MSSSTADRFIDAAGRPWVWILRRLRSVPSQRLGETVRLQQRAHERAMVLIRVFYALSLMWTVHQMGGWPGLREVPFIDPQWPAAWIDESDPGSGISLILLFFGFASLLVAMWPTSRILRALFTVGMLQYLSVKFGFGKVNHDYHAWLWVSAILVFLPSGSRMREPSAPDRHPTLAVLWSAQIVVLFFYTLTGLWKVYYGLQAFTNDRISSFQIDGFSLIVAERLLSTDQATLLGEFLVRNPILGWLLFNGTMYLECASLLAAFRPRLHRLWGGGLILFHLGTQLAMGFTFVPNIALIGLLFMASPWAPDRPPIRSVVLDLPGVHLVAKRWRALQRASAAATATAMARSTASTLAARSGVSASER